MENDTYKTDNLIYDKENSTALKHYEPLHDDSESIDPPPFSVMPKVRRIYKKGLRANLYL